MEGNWEVQALHLLQLCNTLYQKFAGCFNHWSEQLDLADSRDFYDLGKYELDEFRTNYTKNVGIRICRIAGLEDWRAQDYFWIDYYNVTARGKGRCVWYVATIPEPLRSRRINIENSPMSSFKKINDLQNIIVMR